MPAKKQLWLLAISPHRYGLGKVHALNKDGTTFCGLNLGHGDRQQGQYTEVTCKRCRPK